MIEYIDFYRTIYNIKTNRFIYEDVVNDSLSHASQYIIRDVYIYMCVTAQLDRV